jgi:hypothetical protein
MSLGHAGSSPFSRPSSSPLVFTTVRHLSDLELDAEDMMLMMKARQQARESAAPSGGAASPPPDARGPSKQPAEQAGAQQQRPSHPQRGGQNREEGGDTRRRRDDSRYQGDQHRSSGSSHQQQRFDSHQSGRQTSSEAQQQGQFKPLKVATPRAENTFTFVDNVREPPIPKVPKEHSLVQHLRSTTQSIIPGPTKDEAVRMVSENKNSKDLVKALLEVAFKHPLMFDPLNGHGYRVSLVGKVTQACNKATAPAIWFEFIAVVRSLGFKMTRFYAASVLQMLRQYVVSRFLKEGRNPKMAEQVVGWLKDLHSMCSADGVPYDFVLYSRALWTLTNLVGCFDRQNQYRVAFPEGDAPRREAIVAEWVLGHERCVEFDYIVSLTDSHVNDIIAQTAADMKCQPAHSFFHRLAEYYFSTDNVEKLVETLETARKFKAELLEAVVAKSIQVVCAFNLPNALELVLRWRALHSLSSLGPADMYRVLYYFGRSGGGNPCPKCGERYNHRNVSRGNYESLPQHQRDCPFHQMGYTHKGVLEDTPGLPATRDWSEKAFSLLRYSDAKGFRWAEQEWRGFILCCMFAKTEVALQAAKMVQDRFPIQRWDDFLKTQFLRLLRHHNPSQLQATTHEWLQQHVHVSPIALHEVLMGAIDIEDPAKRLATLHFAWERVKRTDAFVMPYAKRYIKQKAETRKAAVTASGKAISAEEESLIERILTSGGPHTSRYNMKDSCADLIPGVGPKQLSQWDRLGLLQEKTR